MEARGHERHNERRKEDARKGDDDENKREGREGNIRQFEGILPGFLLEILRKDGNERNRERPFRQKPPKQVGDPEGHEEGVRHHAGTEEGCHDNIADGPEDPAEHGGHTDNTCRLGNLYIFADLFIGMHQGSPPSRDACSSPPVIPVTEIVLICE